MEESEIIKKLAFLEAEINSTKALMIEIGKSLEKFIENESQWLVYHRKLNEANRRIRELEYENYFLKNAQKFSSTSNTKEEKQ